MKTDKLWLLMQLIKLAYMSHTELINVSFWMFMQCARPAYDNNYAFQEYYVNYLPENPIKTWSSGMRRHVGGLYPPTFLRNLRVYTLLTLLQEFRMKLP